MNKDYLFENSEQNLVYQARVNSRERLLRNQQNLLDRQVNESHFLGQGKRDMMWELKKNQKLSSQNAYPSAYESAAYPSTYQQYEGPYMQNPQIRDFSNQENFFSPVEPRGAYQPMSLMNDSYSPNPGRQVLQPDHSEKPRPDSGKRHEIEKKRLYAEELKRQIEEKNQIRASEAKHYQRRENQAESDPRPRFASADRPNSNIFGQENSTRMSEREKKIKYAKELEAQIQQKRNNQANDRDRNDHLFNLDQGGESASEKKKKYAKELEEQIRSKNNENFKENPNRRRENEDLRPRDSWPKNQDDNLKNDGARAEIDKKIWYRQELERQIEEQKRRKEEEKKKRKLEDEFVEVGIFDAKKELNRPPRDLARNFEVKDPFEDLQKNLPVQGFNKFDKKAEAFEGKKEHFEENPENNFELKKMNQQDLPNQFSKFRPANEILTPFDQRVPFDQEKAAKNMELFKMPSQAEVNPTTTLFEKIMKEMQEVKKERDQAREQCMEMREMMLREKEKNLEQMLQLMRNQSSDFLNNDPRSNLDRPPVYPVKSLNSLDSRKELYDPLRSPNPKPVNDYAQAAYEQVNKKLFMNEEKRFEAYNPSFPPDPRILPQKPDLFEKSLAGNSTFIDPMSSKWNNLATNETSPNDSNPAAVRPRKKWETNEINNENFTENKPLGIEKYSASNLHGLDRIDEGDESLNAHETYIGFNDVSKHKIDEEFYKEFKKKYINTQFDKSEEGVRESKEFQEIWNKENPDEHPSRPPGGELFDKVFGNKVETPEPSSRKASAKGRRAFSRLNDAKKFTLDSENPPKVNSELYGETDYINPLETSFNP